MLGQIHSVMIFTEDVGRLARFYRDKLGMTPEIERDESVIFAAAEPGATQLAIAKHSEVRGRSSEPNRIMIDLVVEDCQREYNRLKAAGVDFVQQPYKDADEGFVVATLQDPDGNTLQMVEIPD